jgi:retron-type reverse transcriptase
LSKTKPFDISKRAVWTAWKRVRANQGAPGLDEQTIADFEEDLAGNLYKIWNRMSSGPYFPDPVRLVDIPKTTGGKRTLGIPTVADRVARMVVKLYLEPKVDPEFHPDPTATGRRSRPQRLLVRRVSAAGSTPGCSILTSRAFSIISTMP